MDPEHSHNLGQASGFKAARSEPPYCPALHRAYSPSALSRTSMLDKTGSAIGLPRSHRAKIRADGHRRSADTDIPIVPWGHDYGCMRVWCAAPGRRRVGVDLARSRSHPSTPTCGPSLGPAMGCALAGSMLGHALSSLMHGQPRCAICSLDLGLGRWVEPAVDRAVLRCARGAVLMVWLDDPKTAPRGPSNRPTRPVRRGS